MLIISTVYVGAGPEDIESLVTKKLEEAVNTLPGVSTIQSSSLENISVVIISYEYGTNTDQAYLDLREKLDATLSSLPNDSSEPTIIEMNISSTDTMTLAIGAEEGYDLLDFVDNEFVPLLERNINIAQVTVSGGRRSYISVTLDKNKMNQYGLNMTTVASYLTAANFTIPAGNANLGSQKFNVSASVNYDSLEQLRTLPITTPRGSVIKLEDVASIGENYLPLDSISRYNGTENISVGIVKRQSASDVSVCRDIKTLIESQLVDYPGVTINVVYDASVQILESLNSIISTLVMAVALSMFILFLFYGDIKASLIVGSSIPISVFLTFILMSFMGYSLNMLTMSALVIGVGMMVDNSIVVLDSCFVTNEQGMSFKQRAYAGTKAVTLSVIASTATTVVVFLPLALTGGFASMMFGQVAFTIVFALLASLISAITLVPLCFALYKPVEKGQRKFNTWLNTIGEKYEKLLRGILFKKRMVLIISAGILIASFALFSTLKMEMFPSIDGGALSFQIETRPGLTLEERSKIYANVEELVASHPDVEHYQLTASGSASLMSTNTSSANLNVYLKDKRKMSTQEVVDQMQHETVDFMNCTINISMMNTSFSSALSSSVGTSHEVTIKGSNLETLKNAAIALANDLETFNGVQRVSSPALRPMSRVQVDIDPILASGYGIVPAQAASTLYSVLSGINTIDVTRNGRLVSVKLEYPKEDYDEIGELGSVSIASPMGINVSLDQIAEVRYTDSPQSISRTDGMYTLAVSAYTLSLDNVEVGSQIDRAMLSREFPEGVTLATTFAESMRTEELGKMGIAILQAVLLVFMVMAIEFESLRNSLMVMVSIPFSLIGSILLIVVSSGIYNMTSLMGVLLLVGTVVNNAILFVDTTNQMRTEMPVEEALVQTGKRRLRPILMTTLTTILSMIPLGLGIGSGAQQMQGMALVIIGGLTASTVLTLLLIPTFYLLIDSKKENTLNAQLALEDDGML
jgi:multidrug efflux pump subunit AcrB